MGYPSENRSTRPQKNNSREKEQEPQLTFEKTWIIDGANRAMIEYAEAYGKYMAHSNLTNSKIRSIYGEIKRIQINGFEKSKTSFYLLKPKVAYALGREPYNRGLKAFKKVFENGFVYVDSQNTFNHFAELFEAILAYHKSFEKK